MYSFSNLKTNEKFVLDQDPIKYKDDNNLV